MNPLHPIEVLDLKGTSPHLVQFGKRQFGLRLRDAGFIFPHIHLVFHWLGMGSVFDPSIQRADAVLLR